METLKAQLLKIQQQLGGLTISQKMLTASLVAIMVMTIVWWAHYAGTSETEPVLDQALSAADMGRIQQSLTQGGIPAKIVNDRVVVPAERKLEAVALLAYSDALPNNIYAAWDEIAAKMSPWDPDSKQKSLQNQAKERFMSTMFSSFFPGVASATVMINPVSEQRLSGSRDPSASVVIKTRQGTSVDNKKLAGSVSATVASAVSGLMPTHVTVIINGVRQRVQDDSSAQASDVYEQTAEQEKRRAELIESFYPGAVVAVVGHIDTQSETRTETTYDQDKTFGSVLTSKTQNESTPSASQQQPVEVGAASNVGLSTAPQAPAAAEPATLDKSETTNQIFPTGSTAQISRPAGEFTAVSAAVRVPRSYFVRTYKGNHPDESKEPDSASIQKIYTEELPTIQKHVQMCTGIKGTENISVDMFYDDGAIVFGEKAGDSAAPSSVGAVVGGHAKEIAVGALAIISLFMVSTIVKKGTPAPTIIPDAAPKETPRLAMGEDIAGIVGDGNPTLDAMEVDDDAIKAQQMVEQVSTMVKENPDAAANLVKRWLNRT
jgi:flagellar biosynthesis/type III secretory pathway M-ring protein FliF/YscJ